MSNDRFNLHDGFEQEVYEKLFEVVFENDKYTFNVNDFYENDLEKLQGILSEESFKGILDTFGFRISMLDKHAYYKSVEDLGVYYLVKDNVILLLSFGEFQPGRYMLFYEGVWNLNH